MFIRQLASTLGILFTTLATVPAWAGACGSASSSSVVAIPFTYHITKDKGRWITLSATSSQIEWNDLNKGWPKRYKAFKFGDGGAAITEWKLDSVPANGTVYEGTTPLSAGATIKDPDNLYYTPNLGYTGEDTFGYCATDATGQSAVAKVALQVHDAANYPMPFGIPHPGFGIDEEPPADPQGWPSKEVAGFYYIDSDHPQCSDSNAYGYPDAPRCSIEYSSRVTAGKKMVLARSTKPYPLRASTWDRIYLEGTSTNPAWIVGDDRHPDKPRITLNPGQERTDLRIEGTGNYRISGVDIDGVVLNNREAGDNIVIRYSRTRANPSTSGGGTTVGLSSGTGKGTNVLAFQVNAHDNGIIHPDFADERDIHAFVGTNQENFWILDVLCSENAGDCVQLTNNNTTKNVYVGRATMHSMMENCIDFKDFNNFVVSESDCWDIRLVSYTSGSGGRGQNFYVNDEGVQQGYGYFLNNRSWDTSGQNFGAANVGGRVYFIGNRAFFSPQGDGLASSNGGGERHYYFNTAIGVRDGLQLYTAGDPERYVSGNFLDDIKRYGSFTSAAYSKIDGFNYNAYSGSMTFAWGSNSTPNTGTFAEFKASTNFDDDSSQFVDAKMVSPLLYDFRLTGTSELVDRIPKESIDAIAPGLKDLRTDLGVSVVDFNGNIRGSGAYDIGAYEYPEGKSPPVPPQLKVETVD